MKNYFYTLVALLMMNFGAINSQTIIPERSTLQYKKNSVSCVTALLEPKPDELTKEFKNYLKGRYGVKLKSSGFFKKSPFLIAEKATLLSISENELDFGVFIDEEKGGSVMKIFACFEKNDCINETQHPQEFASLQRMISDFLKDYLPKFYFDYINDGKKEIKDLKSDVRKTEKNIVDIDEKIAHLEEKKIENQELLKEQKDMIENAQMRLKAREEKYQLVRSQLEQL